MKAVFFDLIKSAETIDVSTLFVVLEYVDDMKGRITLKDKLLFILKLGGIPAYDPNMDDWSFVIRSSCQSF